ncbi:LA_2272 family surface repeat-containing protein [Pseudodesulfovibrio sediminis]|uniref:Uncharacterized protein n=1 Tax=Pseudodesulfovibrio sediminis TaxID=2810563 RepID=A0ABM7P6U1_9BACT|nr:hypothetical protein [Pseudodesulfovibrio sediminis]BCS89235.1 hypothetical protein PSDVSF_24770 [Pseudodesulfovibrio sediminis]
MKKIILTAIICLMALPAFAAEPFQLSLVPDVALHSRSTRIDGVALSIWGENPQSALALGIINGSSGDSAGFSWGFVNYADNYTGVQWGLVNYNHHSFTGWQAGFVNASSTMTGLQTGFINYADTAQPGLQIGLINVIKRNQWFNEMPNGLAPVFPIVNWRF